MPPQSDNNQNPFPPSPQPNNDQPPASPSFGPPPPAAPAPTGFTMPQPTVITPTTQPAVQPTVEPTVQPPIQPTTQPAAPVATPQVFGPADPAAQPTALPTPMSMPTPQPQTSFSPQTYTNQGQAPVNSYNSAFGAPPTTMAYGNNPAAQASAGIAGSTGGGPAHKRRIPAMLLVVVSSAVVLLGGSAAAYFGYYMSPSVVWKDSLSNTGKGYNQLITYLNTESSAHYNGVKENGSMQVNAGGTNYSGSLTGQSYGESATASLKLDLGLTNIDMETRSVPVTGTKDPDVYLQVSGIKDFSSLLGSDFGPKVAALDGKWIVVDHNLIADVQQQISSGEASSKVPQLKWADINTFLVNAGTINQKYVFSTNPSTSVTTVAKTIGKETVDGHKTIHYRVGFVKANVKAYVTAMCAALSQGNLGAFLKNEGGGQSIADSDTCKSAEQSTNKIKPSDTVDVWADASHRLLYKVRINDNTTSNPAENFVDIGLNYTGGTSYPFFFNGQTDSGGDKNNYSIVATLDSKANTLNATIKDTATGSSPMTITGNFTLSPSNQKLTVTAPPNAESMLDVLNSLGLGQLLNTYTQALSSGGASSLTTGGSFNTGTIPL